MNHQAERAVASILRELDPAPPVDVWGLAETLGVAIEVRPMREDGRLHFDRSGRYEIHLSTRSGPARRRFTIAHELGHLWVARCGLGREVGFAQEERFCNSFAAALLIPRPWLIAHAGEAGETLPSLRRLSRLTQTSLSAMLIRLRELLGWRSSLLRYRRASADWRLVASAGLQRLDGCPALSNCTWGELLDAAAAQSLGAAESLLNFRDGSTLFSVEIGARRRTALVLLRSGEALPVCSWRAAEPLALEQGWLSFCEASVGFERRFEERAMMPAFSEGRLTPWSWD